MIGAVLIGAGVAEMFFLQRYPGTFFPWYRSYSKQWISLLSFLFSFVPFSVWDVGALLLVILFISFLIRTIVKKKRVLTLLCNTFLVFSILLFSALQGWLGNHYAPKLNTYLSLEVRQYSFDELYEATEYYFHKAAEYAPLIERDEEGHAVRGNVFELAKTAGASYNALAEENAVFKGSDRPVKVFSLIGDYLLYNGIIGMFMPITGESSVPYNVPVIPQPFAMCHEAAHRLGIASEQEANFCAFLACTENDNDVFVYSGYYEAFTYCFNALYSANWVQAKKLYESADDEEGILLLKQDRTDTYYAYLKYESPLQDISDEINDTYLKTFSEESGIRSYGEVTDYLIAWYFSGRAE